MALRGALASPGRLIDPLVELVGPAAAAGGPFAQLAAWRHRRRGEALNKEALNRLYAADKGFRTDAFLAAAKAAYADVLGHISAGRLAELKPLLTEGAYVAVKRGVDAGVAETGARQGAAVVEVPEPPAVVHARVAWAGGEIAKGPLQAPDVVQLTVRHVTLQAGRAAAPPTSGRDAGHHHHGGGFGGATAPPPDPLAAMGEWAGVADASSGHVYYANATTGAVTWTKPSSSQWATGRLPFRIETAGVSRSLVAEHPAVASGATGGLPLVRVVHHVVWERLMGSGAPPGLWRIAKL
jgi:hypothetical protein